MTWFERDPRRFRLECESMRRATRAQLVMHNGEPAWIEDLVCSASSVPYRLEINYPVDFPSRPPRVFVRRPTIINAPHRFADGSLCLQANPRFEKSTALMLRNRAVLWFMTYQAWLGTGDWIAPEH